MMSEIILFCTNPLDPRAPEPDYEREVAACETAGLYLSWLDMHDRQPGEEAPLGLILCAGKSEEHVELLHLGASGIRVGEYLTDLPPRDVLTNKLGQAIKAARERLASSSSRNTGAEQ